MRTNTYTHTYMNISEDPVRTEIHLHSNNDVFVNIFHGHTNPLTLTFRELDDVIQFADDLRAQALQQFPEECSRCDCGEYSDYHTGPYDGMCYECAADAMHDARADEQIAYAKENG